MSATGQSDRDALLTFHSTWNAPGRWMVQLVCDDRRYVFAPLETCRVQVYGEKGERTIEPHEHDLRWKAGMYEQARCFLEMIATRRVPAIASLESAMPAMALADRLQAAFAPGA
jgi:hypothetical protein